MLVGIVPMGGFGERWAPYPCPKELLPFGEDASGRPRVIGDYVIERMVYAGVDLVVIPVRPEKATLVMRYFGHRLAGGRPVVYVAAPGPTLVANLQACVPLLGESTVLFGMPDTFFTPRNAFRACLEALSGPAELVLGCWEHADPAELDTVVRNGQHLHAVRPKPRSGDDDSREVWGIAVWNGRFTERLHAWCDEQRQNPGHVFQAAAAAGSGRAVLLSGGVYVDIGSYRRYEGALHYGSHREDSRDEFADT